MHPIIESDYLETEEGLFFAVKGIAQPSDRIHACLRYAPDPQGERHRMGSSFHRLYHFAEQEEFLRANYPHYLSFDPICQLILQSVPRKSIRRIYSARNRLQELRKQPIQDAVEADVVAFADRLQQVSGIPLGSLGVSGSVAIGLHTLTSDLDLTVHGERDCRQLHQALVELLDKDAGDIRRLNPDGMQALHAERSADTRMTYSHFLRSERSKVNQGRFRDRTYFIRFLKEQAEFWEAYGDRRYSPLGRAEIQAVVTDHRDAIFTPCRYRLAQVQLLQGISTPGITEIVSFRGRFCEQAQAGDTVRACGMVERVDDRLGQFWHRLILGNESEDTMILGGEA